MWKYDENILLLNKNKRYSAYFSYGYKMLGKVWLFYYKQLFS